MVVNEILSQYRNLILKVDTVCQELGDLYQEYLVCKPGCSGCCEAGRTVLLVEAYIVEQELSTLSPQKLQTLKRRYKANDVICPLLFGNRCVIYPARPIICRTHGLPILYWEGFRAFVDYCRLNFTNLPANYQFNDQNVLDMNPYNVELIEIDTRFAEHVLKKNWRPDYRRSLKNILFNLDIYLDCK